MSFVPDSRGALVALKRFGLGPKPGDLFAAAADPRGFILAETQQAGVALLEEPQLAKSSAALQALFADQQNKRAERERALAQGMASAAQAGLARSVMAAATPQMPVTAAIGPDGKPKPQDPTVEQRLFRAEAMAHFEKQAAASAGFVERWSLSGQTILPFRSPKTNLFASPPGRMSGRRSARMCSANSPTCSKPREPSGDALLSRQSALHGPNWRLGASPERGSMKIWRAKFWSCIRSGRKAAIVKTM